MGMFLYSKRKKPSSIRQMPWLPRFGFYLDIAGIEVVYKQVPMMETVANLMERGFTLSHLNRIKREQFAEIVFPIIKKSKVFQTTAKTISVESIKKKKRGGAKS